MTSLEAQREVASMRGLDRAVVLRVLVQRGADNATAAAALGMTVAEVEDQQRRDAEAHAANAREHLQRMEGSRERIEAVTEAYKASLTPRRSLFLTGGAGGHAGRCKAARCQATAVAGGYCLPCSKKDL